jgi:GNAT superfamily N-acetyltransferase
MPSTLAADYLAAYDAQLRTDAETPSATDVTRLGPLRLVTFPGGRGFVTYRDLDGADARTLATWVRQVLEHYRQDPDVDRVEWKTRGHDHAPHLHDLLAASGFEPDDAESIMIGEARLLDVAVPLPASVTLRRVLDEAGVRAMSATQDVVFGGAVSDRGADALLHRLALDDGMELWVAEEAGQMVGAGRLEPVHGTDFAGIWGGAVLPAWRGRGIYRALTAARARSALALGKRLVHSDSTAFSRPILERSGLVAVSTTTPYHWRRTPA